MLQDVECLEYDDPRIEQSQIEGNMDEYEGTYDDYLELFIQFGYVVSIIILLVHNRMLLWLSCI